ncbi:hypothetical protein M011DRAFT_465425 [Sporormia fimetaria CBS 119925]|uniref:Uncharacterized protein n=1 Tax=Sporormia fimetaria CBS 119925 TaxID=1340428 RepID=A0A6A6VIX9_9PLEO|nr:hypothetical protein M011DRAFT_465425 [Sporormia fimetaria CBS 119925]
MRRRRSNPSIFDIVQTLETDITQYLQSLGMCRLYRNVARECKENMTEDQFAVLQRFEWLEARLNVLKGLSQVLLDRFKQEVHSSGETSREIKRRVLSTRGLLHAHALRVLDQVEDTRRELRREKRVRVGREPLGVRPLHLGDRRQERGDFARLRIRARRGVQDGEQDEQGRRQATPQPHDEQNEQDGHGEQESRQTSPQTQDEQSAETFTGYLTSATRTMTL